MKPLISIIIPVYNAEKYLSKTIDSIINQTIGIENLEIILIDDGSTDSSFEIANKYCDKYPDQIITKQISNSGSSVARNTGIKLSRGEYITFVDSDDYIDEEMYNEMYNIAIKNNSDIIVCGAKVLDEEGNLLRVWESGDIKEGGQSLKENKSLLKDILPAPWNKLYKRELFIDNNIEFPKGVRHQDLGTIPRILLHCKNISKTNKYFYNYIIHQGSITRTYDKKILDIIEVLEIVNEYYIKTNNFDYYKSEIEFLNIEHILFRGTYRAINIKNKQLRKEVCKRLLSFINKIFPNWHKNIYIKTLPIKKKVYIKMIQFGMYHLAVEIFARNTK